MAKRIIHEASHQIILSDTQLLVATGSAVCSIFLFVWALMRLWLSGR
jgi:hypothetical protein